MPYVLDESSYRVDKTVFYDEADAKQRAEEAARILGRPVNVYTLENRELHFHCRVLPDGTVEETNPLTEAPEGHEEPTHSPAVLGRLSVRTADAVAQVLERVGRLDLAAQVDRMALAK